MDIIKTCKILTDYAKANDIDSFGWSRYDEHWNAGIIVGKYHKDAKNIGVARLTLEESIKEVKSSRDEMIKFIKSR